MAEKSGCAGSPPATARDSFLELVRLGLASFQVRNRYNLIPEKLVGSQQYGESPFTRLSGSCKFSGTLPGWDYKNSSS